jgi:putative endonuclease
LVEGFTKKYNLNILVYFEVFERVEDAMLREKRLKKWKRQWKLELIKKFNPQWKDLYEEVVNN